MKARHFWVLVLVVLVLFIALIFRLWPAPAARQSVVLVVVTNYVAQSSNLTSFCVSNIGPRAILLTDLILETKTPGGWQDFGHSVPSHPQRLDLGESKALTNGVPVAKGRWRLRVVYGTDVKGPMLQLAKTEYAITHFQATGPGFGIMAGNYSLVSMELPPPSIASPGEIEIIGSERFSNQVYRAVRLLQSHDLEAYQILTNHVGRIQEGERSGMWAFKQPPTYEMSDTTAFYSLTWCAATMAHDSFHSKLYHDYLKGRPGPVPEGVWTGIAAEQRCMSHQLAVMEQIGASKEELNYARQQADGHYVKDHETWQDYQQRKW